MADTGDTIPKWLWIGFPVLSFATWYGIAVYDYRLWHRFLESELGVVENLQVVFLALTVFYGVRILGRREIWPGRWLGGWVGLMVATGVFAIGEETSWGQHYFGWATPQWLASINDQGESNLHNISPWLDQKPRVLLELAIVVGGIVRPLWIRFRPPRPGGGLLSPWIWPTAVCVPTALLVEISRIPQKLIDFGFWGPGLQGVRHSEVQEYFMYLFMLSYALSLYRRLDRTHAASSRLAE